jgi:pimeloyl-ACP methyl ester carboxylesterase
MPAPVVLVHGSPGSPKGWARVRRELPAELTVATPTLPGHGPEEPLVDRDLGVERRAAVIVDAMREAGPPVTLVGHSFGGVVATAAALQAPELVERLVLIEPVLVPLLDGADDPDAASLRSRFEGYVDAVEHGDADAIATMVGIWFGPTAYDALPDAVREHFRSRAAANARDVRATLAYAPSPAAFGALELPVTVALGAASPAPTRTLCERLVALLPRASLVVVPAAGHAMIDSHPGDVAALIDR